MRARAVLPIVFGCLLSAVQVARAAAADLAIERFQLPNGMRVLIVHVPEATQQTIFSFLPVHLANDGADRPQWAHLIEHMLIRSTDPDTLNPPGMMLNGETMHDSMRLDVIADANQWKPALERVAKWVTARQFDPAVLEREKLNIAGEERGTAMMGHTTKWAVAAWNQVVRHGAEHVGLHASPAAASVDQVQMYATARVPLDESMMLVMIGPIETGELRAEIDHLFGRLEEAKAPAPPASVQPFEWRVQRRATWDLPTAHVMRWWKLPNAQRETQAAATVLASRVMSMLAMSPALQQAGGKPLVFADVPTPEGLFFIVDVCIAKPVEEIQKLEGAVDDALTKALNVALVGAGDKPGQWVAMQFAAAAPDFAAQRRQLPPMQQKMIEANWLLPRAMFEYRWNAPIEDVAAAIGNVDAQALTTLRDGFLREQPGALTLTPQTVAIENQAAQ